jgi:hypothetical protein
MTEDKLNIVEELSGLYFDLIEIAIIMQLPLAEFLKENGWTERAILQAQREYPSSEVALRVAKGKLQKDYIVRKSIFEMAENGSSPAQQQVIKLMEKAVIKQKLR